MGGGILHPDYEKNVTKVGEFSGFWTKPRNGLSAGSGREDCAVNYLFKDTIVATISAVFLYLRCNYGCSTQHRTYSESAKFRGL